MKAERLTSHVKQAPHYLATHLEKKKQKKVIHAQSKNINRMKKAMKKENGGKEGKIIRGSTG